MFIWVFPKIRGSILSTLKGLYRGSIGIMEKKTEATIFPKIRGTLPTIMENQMEKKMENEMETGIIWGITGMRVSQN